MYPRKIYELSKEPYKKGEFHNEERKTKNCQMKTENEEKREIKQLLEQWKIDIEEEEKKKIIEYLQMVIKWNQHINLTGARDIRQIIHEHLTDSFAMSVLIPKNSEIIDVGTGGGLPIIPFAIIRADCKITAIEAKIRKVAFLRAVKNLCNLEKIKIIKGRIENFNDKKFDIACSKATFKPKNWLKMAKALIKDDGRVLVYATRNEDVNCSNWILKQFIEYKTGQGSKRWLGSYCST